MAAEYSSGLVADSAAGVRIDLAAKRRREWEMSSVHSVPFRSAGDNHGNNCKSHPASTAPGMSVLSLALVRRLETVFMRLQGYGG